MFVYILRHFRRQAHWITTSKHTHTHTHMYIHTYMNTCIHGCIHTLYIHTYINTYTHLLTYAGESDRKYPRRFLSLVQSYVTNEPMNADKIFFIVHQYLSTCFSRFCDHQVGALQEYSYNIRITQIA
jgi:hypothetical protein